MSRLEKLRAAMPKGADAVLVSNQKNIRYLTKFDFTDGFALITGEKAYCLADFRYIEAAKEACNSDWTVLMLAGNKNDFLNRLIEENKIKTLAVEDRTITAFAYSEFEKNLKAKIIPAGALVEELREYKEKDEIENIISAQRIAEKAFDHILGYINPDRTEIEVALELEFYMRSHGAEASAFEIIAVSGTASSRPHGVPRDRKLEKGFITMDFGAVVNGYLSDMTRTVCLGKADDEMKKLYNTVLLAQTTVIDNIKCGGRLGDYDRMARDIIDNAGYAGCFGHSLGHGVGMYIHEAPTVYHTNDKKLTEGHVVTVEPGIYVEGKYGARIEDMVVCLDGKATDITKCPKQLIEL